MRLLAYLFALALLPITLMASASAVIATKSPGLLAPSNSSGPSGPSGSAPFPSSTTPIQAPSPCAATLPNGNTPPGENPGPLHHGNGALWTVLWTEGRVVFEPGGPGSVEPDGSLSMKFPWWRGVRGQLTIEGRRLDATAPPLRAFILREYGDIGFQPTALIFPTVGCWEVTGRVSDSSLTFVTQVVKANAAANVSAASFSGTELAADSIATAFGSGLATTTGEATGATLPTVLAGTTVKIGSVAGTGRDAPLFFVSPRQVNYQIPPGTANGRVTVSIISSDGQLSSGKIDIVTVAPGLFGANANGQGAAAAVALRVRADNSRTFEPVFRFDAAQNRFVSIPLDLGPEGEQVFLILFGTGIRSRGSLAAVTARIGGADAQVTFAGAQGSLVSLDQVNLLIPRILIGRGAVEIALTADGKIANTVEANIR